MYLKIDTIYPYTISFLHVAISKLFGLWCRWLTEWQRGKHNIYTARSRDQLAFKRHQHERVKTMHLNYQNKHGIQKYENTLEPRSGARRSTKGVNWTACHIAHPKDILTDWQVPRRRSHSAYDSCLKVFSCIWHSCFRLSSARELWLGRGSLNTNFRIFF